MFLKLNFKITLFFSAEEQMDEKRQILKNIRYILETYKYCIYSRQRLHFPNMVLSSSNSVHV